MKKFSVVALGLAACSALTSAPASALAYELNGPTIGAFRTSDVKRGDYMPTLLTSANWGKKRGEFVIYDGMGAIFVGFSFEPFKGESKCQDVKATFGGLPVIAQRCDDTKSPAFSYWLTLDNEHKYNELSVQEAIIANAEKYVIFQHKGTTINATLEGIQPAMEYFVGEREYFYTEWKGVMDTVIKKG